MTDARYFPSGGAECFFI